MYVRYRTFYLRESFTYLWYPTHLPRSAFSTCTPASKEEEIVRAQVYIGERVRGFPVVAGATRVQRTF